MADLHRALNLHHNRFVLISQPPSLPICDSLPFTIVDLQSLPFTISDLRVKVVVFSYFLFISLFQSHASPVSICVLWIYRLLVFGFIDLFFSVDLFSKICEIFGLWSLSFDQNQIRPLCTPAWFDSTHNFSWSAAGRRPATQPDWVGFELSTNLNWTDLWTPLVTYDVIDKGNYSGWKRNILKNAKSFATNAFGVILWISFCFGTNNCKI